MAMALRWESALAAAVLLACAQVQAQEQDTPAYRCGKRSYTQVPCAEGQQPINAPKKRVNVRYESPSQDRATAARRAKLSAEERQECVSLEQRMSDQDRELKAKANATLQDEMPLVFNKKRYRELGC